MLNLENVLFIEEKLSMISEKLKKVKHEAESSAIIELCEDWWEMVRHEQVLFDVFVIYN